ncbi:pyridoxamine kinase [Stomatobaculum longum]|uniref:pyridoxamine kinase n=1 Tax=Stomatobaculum longum TaxID=796942 RepID=UPI0028E47A4B|nr:pyridoxamine kinase [Stomatobaculum longum]
MAADKKILTIQDISCVGQCSLTVALPIVSACGVETCILPSAVLSNHTGADFHGFTFRDLTEDMPEIAAKWKKEHIVFDAIYTGYLGSRRQIAIVQEIMDTLLAPGGLRIVDPAMADNGALYTGFDLAFVEEMAKLCGGADYILPNLTEACLLTGTAYREGLQSEAEIRELLGKLAALGAKHVILKGISYEEGRIGNVVYDSASGDLRYDFTPRVPRSSHGTGDCFAAAFTGAMLRGKSAFEATKLAARFVVASIRATEGDSAHWYGVKFEKALPLLTEALSVPTFTIEGKHVRDLETFYAEIDRVLTDGKQKTGHNLSAFDDILRGGFGKHAYGQRIHLYWKDFDVSRTALGDEIALRLIGIILDRESGHDCKLEF